MRNIFFISVIGVFNPKIIHSTHLNREKYYVSFKFLTWKSGRVPIFCSLYVCLVALLLCTCSVFFAKCNHRKRKLKASPQWKLLLGLSHRGAAPPACSPVSSAFNALYLHAGSPAPRLLAHVPPPFPQSTPPTF